jgi:hypothetical protein
MVKRQDKVPSVLESLGTQLILLTLMAIPALVYFYCLAGHAINVPMFDDFDFLQQVYLFDQADSIKESLLLLFKQHNEHRMVFNRIIFLLVESISGEVNFRTLALCGYLALPAFLILFYSNFRDQGISPILFVPIPFILFNFESGGNIFWATSVLANYSVLVFGGACFYFLNKNTVRSFTWAMALACAATFTHGNGMGVFPVGLAYLLNQKKYRESIVWLGATSLVVFLYFYDYTSVQYGGLGIGNSLSEPGRIVIYFLTFLGSIFSFCHPAAAPVAGTAIFLYFIYLSKSRYYAINAPLYCFLSFLFLGALAAALSRSGLGIDQALAARYKIHSTLMVIIVLISAVKLYSIKTKPGPTLATGLILGSVFFFGVSCAQNYPKMAKDKESIILSTNQWFMKNVGLFYPLARKANEFLVLADAGGHYKFPAKHLNFPASPRTPSTTSVYSDCLNAEKGAFDAYFNILTGKMQTGGSWVRVEGMIRNVSKNESGTALILKSETDTVIFPTYRHAVPALSIYYNGKPDNHDFLSLFSADALLEGSYQVGLCHAGKATFFSMYINRDESRNTSVKVLNKNKPSGE